MSTVLILLATGAFIGLLLFAVRQMDRVSELEEEARRIEEITQAIARRRREVMEEKRTVEDAAKRLDGGSF